MTEREFNDAEARHARPERFLPALLLGVALWVGLLAVFFWLIGGVHA
jgi:hypothetical protein